VKNGEIECTDLGRQADPSLANTLGKRLRAARENRGLTQEGLGALLHVTHTTINRYEQGLRKPTPEMLRQLADALNVSIDYLVGRTDVPDPELVKEDDAAYLLRHYGDLTPEQKRRLQEYIEFLKFEHRKKRIGRKPDGDDG